MSKSFIQIDADSWMDANGIETTVFLGGNVSEPCFIHVDSYEDLIDRELEAHTFSGKLSGTNLKKVKDFVVALEEAAVYARKRVEELSGGEDDV